MYFSSMTTLVLISLVVIIWMLIPASASARNIFWATPVFYSPQMAPPFLQAVIWANPLTPFIGVVRTAVLDGQAPPASQLGLMALWVSIALGSSLLVFIRYQPRFAEEL